MHNCRRHIAVDKIRLIEWVRKQNFDFLYIFTHQWRFECNATLNFDLQRLPRCYILDVKNSLLNLLAILKLNLWTLWCFFFIPAHTFKSKIGHKNFTGSNYFVFSMKSTRPSTSARCDAPSEQKQHRFHTYILHIIYGYRYTSVKKYVRYALVWRNTILEKY